MANYNKYNKGVVVCLFLTIIALIFVLCLVRSADYTWTNLLQNIAISLLASFLFYVVFLKFNEDNKEKNDKIDPVFVKIGTNSKMGAEHWVNLINELASTEKDIYFYGNSLKLWLETSIYKEALLKELKKRKKRKNKLYFILHKKSYIEQWKSFFDENNISVDLIHIEGNNCYSIVCCGNKMSITLRTNIGRSEDSPSIEVSTKSDVGKLFIEYLRHIVKARIVPNVI